LDDDLFASRPASVTHRGSSTAGVVGPTPTIIASTVATTKGAGPLHRIHVYAVDAIEDVPVVGW